ncbi:MAG: phosphoenolpyruvate carboxylase, partial [Novosphingobium sp.]
MKNVHDLEERLQQLHLRTAETPLFNPVFQLGLEISRALENGEMTLDTVDALVSELECEGLQARARRLNRLVAPLDLVANDALVTAQAGDSDFEAFAARWHKPFAHVVFTAHPTFLLSRAQSAAVAAGATSGETGEAAVCVAPHARDAITLDYEHQEAMAAIARAQSARDRICANALSQARSRWPDRWRELRVTPFRFAT